MSVPRSTLKIWASQLQVAYDYDTGCSDSELMGNNTGIANRYAIFSDEAPLPFDFATDVDRPFSYFLASGVCFNDEGMPCMGGHWQTDEKPTFAGDFVQIPHPVFKESCKEIGAGWEGRKKGSRFDFWQVCYKNGDPTKYPNILTPLQHARAQFEGDGGNPDQMMTSSENIGDEDDE